jgi:hypothetical protein
MSYRPLLAAVGLLLSGCGGGGGSAPMDAADAAPLVPPPDGAETGACVGPEEMPADEGHDHVATCSAVSHASRPPSSGNHYGYWPVFRVYDKPVPWGFLVHALEHGAVVIVYNCPAGCPDEVAAAKAVIDANPAKAGCPRAPVILAPDPTLDVRFAAAAWHYTLRASCFDRARFDAFIKAHVDRGPEMITGDCGAVDLEAAGWCPG